MGNVARKFDDAFYDIPITDVSSVPTSGDPDLVMASTDTMAFTNDAPYAVSITFTTTSGAVFNNIASIAANGGVSATQSPQKNNVTVNYIMTNLSLNKPSTPCAIQVGVGPLRINILAGNTNPDPVSIPDSGEIQFFPDQGYEIQITPPNAFNPALSSIQPPSSAVLKATNLASSASYELIGGIRGTDGKGTVKIGS